MDTVSCPPLPPSGGTELPALEMFDQVYDAVPAFEDPPSEFVDAEADLLAAFQDSEQEAREATYCREALLDLTGVTPHRQFDVVERARWETGQKLAARLRDCGMDDWAMKLAYCHNDRTTAICDGCSKRVVFWNRCDVFWCPQCSPRLAKLRLDGLMFFVEKMRQPKHIVLTLANVPELTSDYLRESQKSLTRLRRRRIFSGARSGLWAMEITNKGKGWHVHFHLVADVPWIPVRELSEAWKAASRGAGRVVWIEDASRGSLKANLPRYVTKYTGKGFSIHEWDSAQLGQFVTAIQGVRTFGVFGELLGARREWSDWLKSIRESNRKCECGCSSKRYYSDSELAWRDNFTGFRTSKSETLGPPGIRQFKFVGL
jgi:hypothetical protein